MERRFTDAGLWKGWYLIGTVSLLLIAVFAVNADLAVAQGPDPTVCAAGCKFSSIQDAINHAADGATIILAAETFTETITVSRSLTIQGAGAGGSAPQTAAAEGVGTGGTIIQAAALPGIATSRVVTVTEGARLTLDGLTIRYGNAAGPGDDANGGGILNMGTLTVTHSAVYSNTAGYQGGGIYNAGDYRTAILRVVSSDIVSNTCPSSGGGIRNFGYPATGKAVLDLVLSAVSGNTAGAGAGIASYADAGAVEATIIESTVRDNEASTHGGGIENSGNQAGSTAEMLISKSTISGNSAVLDGGGVAAKGSNGAAPKLVVALSTISGNSANNGGGLSNLGSSESNTTVSITRCTFAENSASVGSFPSGGGIHNAGSLSSTASVVIAASTFSSNTADYLGGGASNNGSDTVTVTMSISNSTFAGNSTSPSASYTSGGAVRNYRAELILAGTILADSPHGRDCYSAGGTVRDNGHNIIEDGSYCDFVDPGDDPELEPLADNGGWTWTHALQPGSPALDAIPAGDCGAAADQRGVPRPQNSACDIGAYEAVTEAWVDDDWHEQSDVHSYDPALSWGANAFNNVAQAVDAVVGSKVHVLAGAYTETLTLGKDLTIIGESGAESTIIQAAAGPGIATSRVITVSAGVSVTLEGLTIRHGRAADGGGTYNEGALTLRRCTVSDNAVLFKGGGIYSGYVADTHLTLLETTVRDNHAAQAGGGIYNGGVGATAYLAVLQSTLAANTANAKGGGLLNDGRSGSALGAVENTTFSGNLANIGGGIGGIGVSSTVTVAHTTFSANSAAVSGGGLGIGGGAITLSSSIVANSPSGGDCSSIPVVTDGGYNLVGDGTCIGTVGGDPDLGPLQDNGGATWTHALHSSSPALDAIPALDCTAATDQRGLERPKGSGCDIGAYEAIREAWVDDDWTGQPDVDAFDPALTWGGDAFGTVGEGIAGATVRTVHVLTGTYTETLTLDNPVQILGEAGAQNTIIQAASAPKIARNRVMTVTEGVTVTLDGLTIRYGYADGSGAGYSRDGGGIYNMGFLTVSNSIVYSNTAPTGGGGIVNAGVERRVALTIESSRVLSNTAGSRGGGIRNETDIGGRASLTITNSTVTGNRATFDGGGLLTEAEYGRTIVAISGSTFARNSAWTGGAILNYCEEAEGSVHIVGSTFTSNTAVYDGGAIYNEAYENCTAPVTISGSLFSGNAANDLGGAIFNYSEGSTASAPVSIEDSTLAGNTALNEHGGGIYNECGGARATVKLVQSTLSGNSAPNGDGGGVYSWGDAVDGAAVISATHCTIWGNSASGTGGGVHVLDATFAFSNTILAGSPSAGDCTQINGSITDGGFNLVQDGSCIGQPSSFGTDPVLGSLQDNGGPPSGDGGVDPMLTHALLPGSPAIDVVPVEACPHPADQRGAARPVGFGCDTGAFEVDTFSLAVAKSVDGAHPGPGQTITFTIVVSNTGPGTDGALISDTLRAGLNFIGPITLDPPGAGSAGSGPPVLAAGLMISTGRGVTVTFPVSVSHGLEAGTRITNTTGISSTQLATPILGSVTVTVSNVFPIAVDDAGSGFGTDEDSAFTTGTVLPNDSDDNGDSLSVVGHDTSGTKGLVIDKGDGTFGYDPNKQFEDLDAGQQATDVFTYTVGDGHGGTDTATVTITIDGADETITYYVFLPVILRQP